MEQPFQCMFCFPADQLPLFFFVPVVPLRKRKPAHRGKFFAYITFYPDGNLIKGRPVLNVGGHCYVGIYYVQSRYAQAAVLQS